MNSQTLSATMPFALALIATAIVICVDHPIVFASCFVFLVFVIPVCICVGWAWVRNGEPPEVNLSPLIASRSERELARAMRSRPTLSVQQFYTKFYADSGISEQSVASIRRILSEQIGIELATLLPHDDMVLLDTEIDWSIISDAIEQEFGTRFTETELETGPATFDFFVQHLLQHESTAESAR